MTKDTEPLQEALTAHYPTGEWMQPCGNHVLCCSCNENLWGVDRDACKAAWRMHVIEALATPASDVAPVEYETLIAAGFDEYAAHCALRTEPDGGFCHAYFYSDGQWRFQTGGNDLTLADGTILRCVLTKRLFAHPPAHPVDPAGGEALREVAAKYADMGIDERAEAMADNCDGDPWELIGYFREKLRQSQARVDAANNAATGFAKKLAALKGPAA